MNRIELNGSHYEIGLKMGEILKKQAGYPPKYSAAVLEKSRAYEGQVKIYAPDLLDEFRGIADSLGIDYYIPITLEASPYRFQTSSCFVMVISGEYTKSGLPILARNHEWIAADSKNLRAIHTQADGKLKSLGFTFHWPLVSRYGGINEAGLAITANAASFDISGPGIIMNLAIRWVLDTCQSTEEAVAYLEKMPKVWGETYLVIDKQNTIAKVEAHGERTKVTYSDTGFDWNSLLYDSPEMQPYMSQERIADCIEFTSARKAFMQEWFPKTKGEISDQLIIDVLKSHEHKMCYHGREGLEICWSYILKIGDGKALLCTGRPCKNDYVEIEVPQ